MTDLSLGVLGVLSPGLSTLVVDFGRPNYRSLGVSVGGAADRRSLALGNALVGNPPNAAALEICLSGPSLVSTCPLACVVFGAPFQVTTNSRRLVVGHTFTLAASEELRIGGTAHGARAYLCVRGGLLTPEVLGSRSAFAPLRADDALPCRAGAIAGHFLPAEAEEALPEGVVTLRVLAGAQADWFDGGEFYGGTTFSVSTASNRMGLRLRGTPLTLPERELVSEPVCPGSVQVTRDGQCIVLGVDGQTIGGYPKIAQVIATDLDLLGQLRPGAVVRFQLVDIDSAETLYRQRRERLEEWLTRLRIV